MGKIIAHVTDVHLDEPFTQEQGIDARKNWNTILNDISSRGIREIIYGGDIGESTSNQWFFESLSNYRISISLGNHDHYEEVIKHFKPKDFEKKSELYYTNESHYFKFIFLDSSSGSISQEQFDWFKDQLKCSKDIALFVHHPILPIEVEVDKQYALKDRDRIKIELQLFGKRVYLFCGHYHFDDEQTDSHIRQFVTPAGSYQVEKTINKVLVNNKSFGYRIIKFHNEKLSTEVIRFS